ncbi:MAG: extracellular solute-binding protein, partial [Defluviitaleaceae bacterium]|nr:extracellular solute-binding protein [Defluviitaleaceae bacterium]
MKKQKMLLVLMMLVLAIAVMAACTSEEPAAPDPQPVQQDNQQPDATPAPEPEPEPDPGRQYDISIVSWVMVPVNDNSDFERRIEHYNPDVNVTFMAIERAAWHDIMNVRVAAGDIPDIIYRDDRTVLAQFVRQGILAPVPFEMIAEHAPDVWQAAKDYAEYYGSEEVWVATHVDGQNWGIPLMQGNVTIFT